MAVKPNTKLEIAIAEMSVLLKGVVTDIGEIKTRLQLMDEQFARKEQVDKNASDIDKLRDYIQTLEVRLAVTKSELRNWGMVGGVFITLIAAAISALQIHL
jgi:hypothetical protein